MGILYVAPNQRKPSKPYKNDITLLYVLTLSL